MKNGDAKLAKLKDVLTFDESVVTKSDIATAAVKEIERLRKSFNDMNKLSREVLMNCIQRSRCFRTRCSCAQHKLGRILNVDWGNDPNRHHGTDWGVKSDPHLFDDFDDELHKQWQSDHDA